ncbi:glutathione S-transferase [Setomelanomma holmii]|uniref:Glutathione S-transferase n=1 Tax=Setomelanomma holmii TaxID=210430 RepID=A0A9P4H1C3_9PLEO|nr:glutathione S-transferase [Setomelanomma holmii]
MSTPNLTVHHLQVGQGERIPWLLEELGIPYKLELYKRSPLLAPPEFKSKFPLGASPVLEDHTDPSNPVTLAESNAICEYVLTKYGNGKLSLTPNAKNYADYVYWLHFANGTLQPGIFRRAQSRGMVAETDPRYTSNDARVKLAVSTINKRLLKTGAWLAGDEFTAADVMTGWCFTTMRKFEPIDLSEYEGVLAWLKRIGGREAYRRAMGKADPELDVEAGLSAKGPEMVGAFAKAMAKKQ